MIIRYSDYHLVLSNQYGATIATYPLQNRGFHDHPCVDLQLDDDFCALRKQILKEIEKREKWIAKQMSKK